MLIAANLKKFLYRYQCGYMVLAYSHLQATKQIITCQVLGDDRGELMAIYPFNRRLDIDKLNQLLERRLTLLPTVNVNRIFDDCEEECWPPVAGAYGVNAVIDQSISKYQKIYFSSGSHSSFIEMKTNDFFFLNSRAKKLSFLTDGIDSFSLPIMSKPLIDSVDFTRLPDPAKTILQLIASEGIQRAATLIREDKLLQPDSEFWQHAYATANLAEKISHMIKTTVDCNLVYLAGLTHNFGLLLFGYLFPPEYRMLQKWLLQNPKASITQLEPRLLGMGGARSIARGGHALLGAQLLRYWEMPEPLCTVAFEHHRHNYAGEWPTYQQIVQLANQILRQEGIGDGEPRVDQTLLDSLSLTLEQVKGSIAVDVLSGR